MHEPNHLTVYLCTVYCGNELTPTVTTGAQTSKETTRSKRKQQRKQEKEKEKNSNIAMGEVQVEEIRDLCRTLLEPIV